MCSKIQVNNFKINWERRRWKSERANQPEIFGEEPFGDVWSVHCSTLIATICSIVWGELIHESQLPT